MITWESGKACFLHNAMFHLDCVCHIFLMECFPSLNNWYLYKSTPWLNLRSPKVYFKCQCRAICWHTDVHDTYLGENCRLQIRFFSVFNVILDAWRISFFNFLTLFWNSFRFTELLYILHPAFISVIMLALYISIVNLSKLRNQHW